MNSTTPDDAVRRRLAASLDVAPADLRLQRLQGGQSNRSWRATVGICDWFVREGGGRDAELGVDRRTEWQALQLASRAGLAPAPLEVDLPSGWLVTEWIEAPAWTAENAREPARLRRLARALRRLHAIAVPESLPRLDLGAAAQRLLDTLPANTLSTEELTRLRSELPRQRHRVKPQSPVLCHNDLHHENILDGGAALRFVDWEYAAAGDARVDLAAIVRYHDLDAAATAGLLEDYHASIDAGEFAAVCWLFDVLHLAWLAVAGLRPATQPRFAALRTRLLYA